MAALMQALFESFFTAGAEQTAGKDITSPAMYTAIRAWFACYLQREETAAENPCRRLPYSIINKLTKTVFAEYDSSIANANKSPKLVWQDSNRQALDKIRKDVLQWTLCGGEGFIKPVISGKGFEFRFIRRGEYLVLNRSATGAVQDVCTAEQSKVGGFWYTLVERRTVDEAGLLTLSNTLYRSSNKSKLGVVTDLTALPQYAGLAPTYIYPQPLHSLGLIAIKTPMVNCVDGSADGISVLEPVLGLIQSINQNEKQFSSEFELGRSRIIASRDMLEFSQAGKAQMNAEIFIGVEGAPENTGVTIFSPPLRDASYENRLQSYLREAETLIGLKRGILSNVEAVERTAKEITSSEGDYSLTIQDFQQMWYDALRETLRVCEVLGRMYRLCGLEAYDPDCLCVTWGNGILYDRDKERNYKLQLVQGGLLKPELYLAWDNDLPCDTPQELEAIREKYLPAMESLLRGV